MASQADEIREYAVTQYVRPWRRSGGKRLSIRAGDVVRGMRLHNATPNVCSALEGRKFQQQAGLVLILREGPQRSTTTTFHYEGSRASPDRSVPADTGTTVRTRGPKPPPAHPRRERHIASFWNRNCTGAESRSTCQWKAWESAGNYPGWIGSFIRDRRRALNGTQRGHRPLLHPSRPDPRTSGRLPDPRDL